MGLVRSSDLSRGITLRNASENRRLVWTCRKFPQKREHQISTSLRESSLFWASCEMSRECDGQGERRALSLAGWTSTAVLRAIHSHDNFVRLWNLDAFCVLQALLITDTIFSLPFWPINVWNSFQQWKSKQKRQHKTTIFFFLPWT